MGLLSSMVTMFPSKGHLKLTEYYQTYVNHMLDLNNQSTTQSITINQLIGQILITFPMPKYDNQEQHTGLVV